MDCGPSLIYKNSLLMNLISDIYVEVYTRVIVRKIGCRKLKKKVGE